METINIRWRETENELTKRLAIGMYWVKVSQVSVCVVSHLHTDQLTAVSVTS